MKEITNKTEKQDRFKLKTLFETSRLLIESRETDFVLNNLLLITMGKMLVPRGAILIYEPGNKKYLVSKIKGKAQIKEGEHILIPWSPNQFEELVIDPLEKGIQTPELFEGANRGLYFNLRTSDHHLGYLYLGRKGNDRVFTEQEMEFVESLTIISSVAIANSRMFTEMRAINRKLDRRIYELNTLLDLSRDFNLMVDREKIASTLKFALLGQLMIRKFFLLYDIDDNLVMMASNGLDRQPHENEKKDIFSLPEDVLLMEADHYKHVPFLRENEISALVALQMGSDKTAVVGVSDKATREKLSQSDFNFLQSLGNLAVLSIQRSIFLEDRIEKERLEEEVNIAKTIQKGLFPDHIPSISNLEVAAKNVPSEGVGGDYYDIVETPDSNHIFAIGDVTGKGIPAALLMANLQAMLHVLLPVEITLSEATDRINNLIFENTPSDKFITFFWGKYFHSERRFKYINAGHNPPLLLRNNGDEFQNLEEGGLILGAMATIAPYVETEVEIEKGDVVVFFTDGVTETFNRHEVEYDEKRLKAVIAEQKHQNADKILNAILNDVNAFSDGKLSDDLTLIVVKGV